jgi:hypothetical protein
MMMGSTLVLLAFLLVILHSIEVELLRGEYFHFFMYYLRSMESVLFLTACMHGYGWYESIWRWSTMVYECASNLSLSVRVSAASFFSLSGSKTSFSSTGVKVKKWLCPLWRCRSMTMNADAYMHG